MNSGREGFPKSARLRRRGEFTAVGKRASRRVSRHFVFLVAEAAGGGRIGITVSRKVGGAVDRNRVKRLIREVFRRRKLAGRLGADLVVIARPGASGLAYDEAARELGTALGEVQAVVRKAE